jgi:hypothetical protein
MLKIIQILISNHYIGYIYFVHSAAEDPLQRWLYLIHIHLKCLYKISTKPS